METLEVGAKVEFAHREADLKLSYPFYPPGKGKRRSCITMIAGGTGITPMYQAMEAILNGKDDFTEVVLLYGNHAVADILLKDELEKMELMSEGRFTVVHVVGSRDTKSIDNWEGEVGWVDKEKVRCKHSTMVQCNKIHGLIFSFLFVSVRFFSFHLPQP